MKRREKLTARKISENNASMPKYTIGVVSQLLGLPPQVLRRYEEAGLLEPARQAGKNRLYSDQDIAILEEIVELGLFAALDLELDVPCELHDASP